MTTDARPLFAVVARAGRGGGVAFLSNLINREISKVFKVLFYFLLFTGEITAWYHRHLRHLCFVHLAAGEELDRGVELRVGGGDVAEGDGCAEGRTKGATCHDAFK